MTTRLATVAPEVQRMLDASDELERLAIARVVVEVVVAGQPDLPRGVAVALRDGNAVDAAAIANVLDDRYLDLDEAGDPRALEVFCQARTALAVRFLLEKAPLEALYEAAIAIDNPDELLRLVQEAANGAV